MLMRWLAVPALLVAFTGLAQADECPALLQGSLPKLRANESIDLCQRFAGKPLVVVNTHSHFDHIGCKGLEVIGVPSNDFKQESKDGAETAKVCYVNYGVTFTMTEPQKVRGDDATNLFKVLARQSSAPKWNFYKYVVDRQGKVIASFSSLTKPDDPEFIEAVEKALASPPLAATP